MLNIVAPIACRESNSDAFALAMSRRTALIVEEQEIYQLGLASLLSNRAGFKDVVVATSFRDAVSVLNEQHETIDLATFGLDLPDLNGPGGLQEIRCLFPHVPIAVVTASERREDILAALAAGVHAYIPKSQTSTQMLNAIEAVLNGGVFVPPSITALPSAPSLCGDGTPSLVTDGKLTQRQKEILHLMRHGGSNKEIARRLGLTENTVKAHANALYRALGVHTRSEAIRKFQD